MPETQDTTIAAIMEQLIDHGPDGMAQAFAALFNLAMRIERERFLGAGHYERSAERRGYGNGSKLKQLDTLGDMVSVEVPKSAGHVAPFYPQSLERGRRSSRAVMAKFGLESLSSSQVSRGAKLLDEELEAWRKRPLGCVPYLLLDARYEKMRVGGIVRDCAVLTAIGIGLDQRRHVLGVSCALSEAESAASCRISPSAAR